MSKSPTFIQPYLFFNGRCEEAVEFYRSALGAELLMLMRYKESPEPCPEGMLPSGNEDKIMHASFHIGDTLVMASDGRCSGKPDFQGFCLSLTVPDEDEAHRVFSALAKDGKVEMPLGKTFWSPLFGIVEDKFGVGWMITLPI